MMVFLRAIAVMPALRASGWTQLGRKRLWWRFHGAARWVWSRLGESSALYYHNYYRKPTPSSTIFMNVALRCLGTCICKLPELFLRLITVLHRPRELTVARVPASSGVCRYTSLSWMFQRSQTVMWTSLLWLIVGNCGRTR